MDARIGAPNDTTETRSVISSVEPEEIPYGLRIGDDGLHLEPNPVETTVLLLILKKIVMEERLSQIADDLNNRGFRTRRGTPWAPPMIFNLLPRLIEAGPKLLMGADWRERRRQISPCMSQREPAKVRYFAPVALGKGLRGISSS